MIDFLVLVLQEIWYILKEASIFLLFGFALAGVLAVLVPAKTLMRFFGASKVKSVLWASAIGAPLPLCSCGVLPTALGLRRQGASKGATVSFLISTPETGLDSISLTYALMDPIMTVFRPVTAVTTAITAGLATNFFGGREPDRAGGEARSPEGMKTADACCDDGHAHHHGQGQPELPAADEATVGKPRADLSRTVRDIYGYAFRDLLDEIAYWLVLGIVLSGVIAAVLPADIFERYLDDPLASMLVMLVVGIPLYTCASAATTVMATLVLKGLNPGAALVFLLAGPATSLSSITVLLKFLGARVVALYLASIAVVSLLAGFTLNWTYQALAIDPRAIFGTGTTFIPEPLKVAGGLLLVALLLLSMRRTQVPAEWLWLRDRFARSSGIGLTARRLQLGTLAAVVLLYLSSGLFSVQPGEVGLWSRFGAIVAPDLAPGLHFRLPWPFEDHRIVATDLVRRVELGFRSGAADLGARTLARNRLTVGGPSNPVPNAIKAAGTWFEQQSVPEESFLLAGDDNLIDLRFSVQYRVRDAVVFAYRMAEPEALVRSLTLAALRGIVGTSGVDAVYTTARGAIEQRVRERVQTRLDGYGAGIELLSMRLLYVHPPTEVHNAFRDVASAQEDKLRTINRASTFAVEDVNQAKGEAAAMIERAQAFKEARILRADGEAAGFGLKVDAYRQAPGLTRFRLQLEALEAVMPGVQKLIRPGADDLKVFDLWLLEPPGTARQ